VTAKLEELDRQNIDLTTFQKFAEKHQALLYPAFEMQTRFHDHVLGTNFWQILIENRVKMFDNRYVSVTDILARYEERIELNQLNNPRHSHHNNEEHRFPPTPPPIPSTLDSLTATALNRRRLLTRGN
jgi:hypothetical protein